MRHALAALLVAFASPAVAADCAFYNSTGQSIAFTEDGQWLTFDGGVDDPLTCPYTIPPNKIGWWEVDCGIWKAEFIRGASAMGSTDWDIVVFNSVFFYWSCPARS